MLSVGILAAILIIFVLLFASVVAWTACRLGSDRGRLRFGLLFTLLLALCNVAFAVVGAFTTHPVLSLILLAAQLAVYFTLLQRIFRVSTGRTWALVGVCVLLGIFQIAIAMGIVSPFLLQ